MKRPPNASIVVSLLAATVLLSGIGCGGGGGGGSSSSGGSGGTTGTRPNGSIVSETIVGVSNGSTAARSTANLRTGDVVELKSLALYTSSANGYEGGFYEGLTNVTLNAPPSVATLVGTTLRAVGPGTGTITATGARGTTLTVDLVVSSNLARVSGRVRSVQVGTANSSVATAVVRFFDAAGNEVASTISGPDGRYIANIPTSAKSFAADFSTLPNSFYNQFAYNSLDFSAGISGCAVALPSFSVNSAISLNDIIAYRKTSSTPPPPPPDGCGS